MLLNSFSGTRAPPSPRSFTLIGRLRFCLFFWEGVLNDQFLSRMSCAPRHLLLVELQLAVREGHYDTTLPTIEFQWNRKWDTLLVYASVSQFGKEKDSRQRLDQPALPLSQ